MDKQENKLKKTQNTGWILHEKPFETSDMYEIEAM